MRTVAAFLRDERGSYTIEFCLWIPVFFFFLAATIDASLLYLTHNALWNAARDTARRVTVGEFATAEEARDYAYQAVTVNKQAIDKIHVPPWNGNSEVLVEIFAEIRDADAFGIFGIVWLFDYASGEDGEGTILDTYLHARVIMRLEPNLV